MAHKLPELGYAYDALEPHIDARTMEIHHSKHHATYVAGLNGALEGNADLEGVSVRWRCRHGAVPERPEAAP